jgi:GT2 family glycosyltransferase
MNPLRVSVCIANYNGTGIIDACIRSVLAQDCGFPVEIIVHDDASTDGSGQHVRERYPTVRLLESSENVGFCVSNNRMVEVAQGEYILLLNNDAELLPDALSSLMKAAENLDKPAILGLPQYDFETGTLIDRGCLLDPFFNPVPNLDPTRMDVAMVIGACLWIPKSLWNEIGGFPAWFGSIAEDMYVCCVARLWGHPVRALPFSGYRHRQGKSFGGNRVTDNRLSTTFRRRALSERNKTFVMALCTPSPILAILLPLHLIALWCEGGALSLLKRERTLWHRIYAPLLPSLWQTRGKLRGLRQAIQRSRKLELRAWFGAFRPMPYKLHMWLRHGLPSIR